MTATRVNGVELYYELVDIVAGALPRAERVTIDRAGHVPHISVPDRYVELVRSFVRTERSDREW
jgi:pimeloyl-ACP methyl ester carboxylesterase